MVSDEVTSEQVPFGLAEVVQTLSSEGQVRCRVAQVARWGWSHGPGGGGSSSGCTGWDGPGPAADWAGSCLTGG